MKISVKFRILEFHCALYICTLNFGALECYLLGIPKLRYLIPIANYRRASYVCYVAATNLDRPSFLFNVTLGEIEPLLSHVTFTLIGRICGAAHTVYPGYPIYFQHEFDIIFDFLVYQGSFKF